jgi:hypothetical protein
VKLIDQVIIRGVLFSEILQKALHVHHVNKSVKKSTLNVCNAVVREDVENAAFTNDKVIKLLPGYLAHYKVMFLDR